MNDEVMSEAKIPNIQLISPVFGPEPVAVALTRIFVIVPVAVAVAVVTPPVAVAPPEGASVTVWTTVPSADDWALLDAAPDDAAAARALARTDWRCFYGF